MIDQWVVVNEPYLFPERQANPFCDVLGYDYIWRYGGPPL